MDFNKIMQNKPLFYGIIAGIVGLIIVIILFFSFGGAGSKANDKKNDGNKVIKGNVDILTTDNLGKAIEIQALLARENIYIDRVADGTKSKLVLKDPTKDDRDKALLAIVRSGLMDQNVGLEIFDKGDFTSTKEDKRIRLSRAINGELARLIRKIPPIENATVFISIPEQTMYANDKKPITATVQVTLADGDDMLDPMKVRAIQNLLLGSVSGLELENISLTDTNGNTYSSMIRAEDEILRRLKENDKYMEDKIKHQLDKLVGRGSYVVTVSTFLRQSPVSKTTIGYDPKTKTTLAEQTFSEGLGDQTRDQNQAINAVSVYLPNGLPAGGANSQQNRSYSRTAREAEYGVSKVQTDEVIKPGTIEDITIAITLDQNAIPANTNLEELKDLVASAASPKATADNVKIAFADDMNPYLANDKGVNLPKPDTSGNPWWIAAIILAVGLVFGLRHIRNKVKQAEEKQADKIESLATKTAEQEKQLRDVNLKAAELIERQTQLAQGLIEQQQERVIQQQPAQQPQRQQEPIEEQFDEAISNISSNLDSLDDDDEALEKVKSWIEKT